MKPRLGRSRQDTIPPPFHQEVTPVIIRATESSAAAELHLASRGPFLASRVLFELGELLTLEIPLPHGTVQVKAKVVGVENAAHAAPGMQIELVNLSQADKEALWMLGGADE